MSQQVSWQNAFWAVIPMALNSMIQPSGMTCGFPSKYGVFLRSSPIMCVIDAIEVLASFMYGVYRARSVRAAARQVTAYRFRDVEANSALSSPLRSLEENPLVRFLVFVLGTLPQAIKLGAMQGIPLTKTTALMFLCSFAIIEIIVVVAGAGGRGAMILGQSNQPRLPGLGSKPWHGYTAAATQTAFWFVVVNVIWPPLVAEGSIPLYVVIVSCPLFLILYSLLCVSPLFVFVITTIVIALLSNRLKKPFPMNIYLEIVNALLCYAIGIYCGYRFAVAFDESFYSSEVADFYLAISFNWSILATILVVPHCAFNFLRGRPTLKISGSMGSAPFFCMNFLAVFLVSQRRYDPVGTYRPEWTSNLP